MATRDSTNVAQLLRSWREGDEAAFGELVPLVYAELRRVAERYLRKERADHTLQPTALVHEAYIRLVSTEIPWADRAHFFSVAARTMRRVLVDHAREKGAVKRGANWVRTTLEEGIAVSATPALELVHLDRAMNELAARDDRAAKASELHYFAGLSYEDTARVLNVSPATVHRDLRVARAWFRHALSDS